MKKIAIKLFTITVSLLFFILPEVQAQMTWDKMTIQPTDRFEEDITLKSTRGTSATDIFAVGKFSVGLFKMASKGIILHFDGDGDNNGNPDDIWEEVNLNEEPKNLNALCKGTKNVFFAVGDGGSVFAGEGKNWIKVLQKKSYGNFQGVWVSPQNTIYAVGGKGFFFKKGIFVKGIQGGQGWSAKFVTNKKLNAVWGISEQKLFAVGDGGTILFSSDGGATWVKQKNPDKKNHNLNSIWGFSDNVLFTVGDGGTILFSSDGGKTWKQQKNPVTEKHNLKDIRGISPKAVFAVGDNGIVLHYDGKDWSKKKKPEPAKNLNGIWISPNPHIFIVGDFIWGGEFTGQYSISGNVYDLRNRSGVVGATIEYKPYGCSTCQWSSGRTTTTGGAYSNFDTYPHSNVLLKFNHVDYDEIVKPVELQLDCNIPNETYMVFKNQQSSHTIAGVISEACQEDPSYSCAIDDVEVKLYKAEGCEFPEQSQYDPFTTENDGHYSFTGLGDGIYKVESTKQGYTFTPQYPDLSQPYQVYNCDFVPSQP